MRIMYLEILLGCWLVASAWVLPNDAMPGRSTHAVVCGALTVAFAGTAFFRSTGGRHSFVGLVGLWLFAGAYPFVLRNSSRSAQNDAVIALLLLMLALFPGGSKPTSD
jgi:hypothetical protein